VADINELLYDWGPVRSWFTVKGGTVVHRDDGLAVNLPEK